MSNDVRGHLVPLPPQPADVPWPTVDWPSSTAPLPGDAAAAVEEMFRDHERFERTYAVLVVHHGELVSERYADVLEHWDRPAEVIDRDTPLLSWSIAKSMLHAAVGIAVGDGLLELEGPHPSLSGRPRTTRAAPSPSSTCSRCATGSTSTRTTSTARRHT